MMRLKKLAKSPDGYSTEHEYICKFCGGKVRFFTVPKRNCAYCMKPVPHFDKLLRDKAFRIDVFHGRSAS